MRNAADFLQSPQFRQMQTNRERTIRAHFRSLKFLRKIAKEEEFVCVNKMTTIRRKTPTSKTPRRNKRRGYSYMTEPSYVQARRQSARKQKVVRKVTKDVTVLLLFWLMIITACSRSGTSRFFAHPLSHE